MESDSSVLVCKHTFSDPISNLPNSTAATMFVSILNDCPCFGYLPCVARDLGLTYFGMNTYFSPTSLFLCRTSQSSINSTMTDFYSADVRSGHAVAFGAVLRLTSVLCGVRHS